MSSDNLNSLSQMPEEKLNSARANVERALKVNYNSGSELLGFSKPTFLTGNKSSLNRALINFLKSIDPGFFTADFCTVTVKFS